MQPIELLERRVLLSAAAAPVYLLEPDGTLVIRGTRRADTISIVEHFPASGIYDVLVRDQPARQYTGLKDVWIDARGGNDVVLLGVSIGLPIPGTVHGGAGNDQLTGGAANDTLHGDGGRDTLNGLSGNDLLLGGRGNDDLTGADGDDRLDGGAGVDVLSGGIGDDILAGGRGRDTLDGADGNDELSGGRATDSLTGGPGADSFSRGDTDAEIADLAAEDARNFLP